MPQSENARKCAEWLSYCLSIGWDKKHLDALQKTWNEYHDENGNLTKSQPQSEQPENWYEQVSCEANSRYPIPADDGLDGTYNAGMRSAFINGANWLAQQTSEPVVIWGEPLRKSKHTQPESAPQQPEEKRIDYFGCASLQDLLDYMPIGVVHGDKEYHLHIHKGTHFIVEYSFTEEKIHVDMQGVKFTRKSNLFDTFRTDDNLFHALGRLITLLYENKHKLSFYPRLHNFNF